MEICPENVCTGCFACINACAQGCITMEENCYGELHPIVDEPKCIHCGLCQRVCPSTKDKNYHYPTKCMASWITDKEKRRVCASGGIGTIMSEYTIHQQKGIVFGSRYDGSLTPIMTYAEHIDELEMFKGSRYVQSIVGEKTFMQAKNFLNEGRQVLFIGTPCQIAGLNSFLGKEYPNLITVDLICHGVTPTSYFKEEVKHISSEKRLSKITNVRFRGNDSKNFCFSLWNNDRCVYNKRGYTSYYLAGFLLGVTLRECCYSCPYARPERVSDITIGDFIGLGWHIPFKYSTVNVSSVLINTKKGETFYKQVSNYSPKLQNIERDYKERLEYKPSLVEPFKRHSLNSIFRVTYLKGGYIYASRRVLKDEVEKYKVELTNARIRRVVCLPYRAIRKVFRLLKS